MECLKIKKIFQIFIDKTIEIEFNTSLVLWHMPLMYYYTPIDLQKKETYPKCDSK